MKGRTPPPVYIALPRADDPSLAIDLDFFKRNPGQREYTRHYITGETPEPMHPDTWVRVMMIGGDRVRGFAPPRQVERLN